MSGLGSNSHSISPDYIHGENDGQDGTDGTNGNDGAGLPTTVVEEAGTSRTLALTDNIKYIRCTNAGGCTITVPPQADVAWTNNAEVWGRGRSGAVTFVAGAGVTLEVPAGLDAIARAGGAWTLKREAEDVWAVIGYLEETP